MTLFFPVIRRRKWGNETSMAKLFISPQCGFLVCFLLATISSASSQGDLPPHITYPNSQAPVIVYAENRHDFTITCIATGHPLSSISYQWKKNDILLRNSDENVRTFTNGTLRFRMFSDNDNGFYQCLAANNLGTSVSTNVPIWNEKPATTVSVSGNDRKEIPVPKGDPVSLSCGETPDTVPKWSKRWYLSEGSKELQLSQRISTDSEGNLGFAYTTEEDEKSYICGLVPEQLKSNQGIVMYKTIDLKVTPNTADPQRPLQTQYYSGGGKVKGTINKDIILECIFFGNPLANITWKPDPRGTLKEQDWGRQLKISNLQDMDEGDYVCEANNGFDKLRQIIYVNVTSPPMQVPHQGMISNTTAENREFTVKCHTKAAHGESLDTPVWFRNGQRLDIANLPDPARYSFNEDRTELHIKNVKKGIDTACFQCNVSNSEGYTFYDAYLRVIEAIKITKHPDPLNEINRNQIIDISVHATGDECCPLTYSWYLNGVLLQDELEKPPYRRGAGGSLWLDPRNVSDDLLSHRVRRHQCVVSNHYDTATYEFTVEVKGDDPLAIGLVSGGFQLWWIILLIVLLLLVIIVIIVFFIVRRNYPGESYPVEKTELEHHLNPKEDLINQGFQDI